VRFAIGQRSAVQRLSNDIQCTLLAEAHPHLRAPDRKTKQEVSPMSISSTGDFTRPSAYTVPETAEILRVSEATVWRLVRRQAVESVLIGRSRRITARSVDKLLTPQAA
jgi:excisionase family DNA binding protein